MAHPGQQSGVCVIPFPAMLLDMVPKLLPEAGFEMPSQAHVDPSLHVEGKDALVPYAGPEVLLHLGQHSAPHAAPHALARTVPLRVPDAGLWSALQVVPDALFAFWRKALAPKRERRIKPADAARRLQPSHPLCLAEM